MKDVQMAEQQLLIVDDEEAIRDTLKEMLDIFGHSCDAVENGEIAVEQISTNPDLYKAVFLDLYMPGMDGLETLEELRKHAPELPIYIISGSDRETLDMEFKEKGATGLLPKPFRINELQKILETL